MAIIVFQHDPNNRPGRLGATLRDHAHRLDIRKLYEGDEVPPDFDNVTGVISLGGHQNVGEDHPWMEAEMAFLRDATIRQIPVIGVCLGAQLIAAALGGEVDAMDEPEVGFHTMRLTPAAHMETAMAGVAWEHKAFCHHSREITKLPVGGTLLASSDACKVQAFKTGLRTYAFQWHMEADAEQAMDINRASEESTLSESDLSAQLKEHYQTFGRLSSRICENIAEHVTPPAKLVGSSGGRGGGS